MALTPITRLGPPEIVAALGGRRPALLQPQTATAADNSRTGNGGYFDYGSQPAFEISASGAMGQAAGPGSLL